MRQVRPLAALCLLLLGVSSAPAAALDQIVPVNVQAVPVPVGEFTDVPVLIPAGATDIVGWTGRLWGPNDPSVLYSSVSWFHNGGTEHKLDAQFTGATVGAPYTFWNAQPVMLPGGTGHRLTSTSDLVWVRFRCVAPTTPICNGHATFYFRVP